MKRPFMVWIGFISICCSKVAKEGKSCPRLLVLQRVAQNGKVAQKLPSTIYLCLLTGEAKIAWIENRFREKESDCMLRYKAPHSQRGLGFSGDFAIQRRDGNENVKNNNRFRRQNKNFARASHFFCTFLCHFCTTTSWNCLWICLIFSVLRGHKKATTKFCSFLNLNMGIRLLMISSNEPSPPVRVDKVAHPGYFHNTTVGSLDSQASHADVPVPRTLGRIAGRVKRKWRLQAPAMIRQQQQQQLYWLYLRHEDFSTKTVNTMTNETKQNKS